jgi:hypothetical protein
MQQPERCYQRTDMTEMGDFKIVFQMRLKVLTNRDCSLAESDKETRHTSAPTETTTIIDQRESQFVVSSVQVHTSTGQSI